MVPVGSASKAGENPWQDETCPISLLALAELEHDPFGLFGSPVEAGNAGLWGAAALKVPASQAVHWFDGSVLAASLVSSGNFYDPVNRRELTRQECVSLDSYLDVHSLPKVFVTEAFDLSKRLTSDNAAAKDELRAAQLRQEAKTVLDTLMNGRQAATSGPFSTFHFPPQPPPPPERSERAAVARSPPNVLPPPTPPPRPTQVSADSEKLTEADLPTGTEVFACFYGEWHPGVVNSVHSNLVEVHWLEEASMSILPLEAIRLRHPPPNSERRDYGNGTVHTCFSDMREHDEVDPDIVPNLPCKYSLRSAAAAEETAIEGPYKSARGCIKKYFADKGFGFLFCDDEVCRKSDGEFKDVYFTSDALLPAEQNSSIIGAVVAFQLLLSHPPRAFAIRKVVSALTEAPAAKTKEGMVKLFNKDKGFGFIVAPEVGDVWFPQDELPVECRDSDLVHQLVTFELYTISEKARARNLRLKEVKPGDPLLKKLTALAASAKKIASPSSNQVLSANGHKVLTVEGHVRSYSPKDGYGFVTAKAPCAPNGADFWFKRSEIHEPHQLRIKAGTLVVFEPVKWPNGNLQGRNVRVL